MNREMHVCMFAHNYKQMYMTNMVTENKQYIDRAIPAYEILRIMQ